MSKSNETCEIPIFLYQFWVHRGSSVREHEGIVVSVQHGVAFIDFYCAGPWSKLVVLLEKWKMIKLFI